MDELIREMLAQKTHSLSFKGQIKTLICKYTDTDRLLVGRLMETLMALEEPMTRL